MTDSKELNALIEAARKLGATVVVTYDEVAKMEEGRDIIQTVQVTGLRGVSPRPLSAFYALKKLREAVADAAPFEVLKDERADTGWISGLFRGHGFKAKVFDEPSKFGIGKGRVSKLSITHRNEVPGFCYSYDRGLDFDHAPEGLAAALVAELEKLPRVS